MDEATKQKLEAQGTAALTWLKEHPFVAGTLLGVVIGFVFGLAL